MRDTLRGILLGRFSDLVIKEVVTFAECLALLDGFKPDIVMLNLTDHSGYDVHRLRQVREKDSSTIIMLLLDYDIDEYRKEAILHGANYIISKDLWTGNEILALLETIFSSSDEQSSVVSKETFGGQDFLNHPTERRNKSRSGNKVEKEFLTNNKDRRKWN
jgi:DNA-binding NarL/FixJ family response regulator